MDSLVDIFGPSASDSAKLGAIFGSGGPDFSDVVGGSSAAAEDARRKKLAQMALARQATQQGAPNQGLGGAPGPSWGELGTNIANRAIIATAEGIASIPEMASGAVNALLPTGVTVAPGASVYPTIGKPGGFFDMHADRENIRQQDAAAQEKLLSTPGADPYDTATVDTAAQALGMFLPIGEGAKGAKALEGAGARMTPELGGVARAVENSDTPALTHIFGPPAAAPVDEAAAEAAFLANRAKVMRTIPGAEAPFIGQGAIQDALRPESALLQVGTHPDAQALDVAMGMRARPQDAADAAELGRQSLAIGEKPATTYEGYRYQDAPGPPASHPERGGTWFTTTLDPKTYKRPGGNTLSEGGAQLVSGDVQLSNPYVINETTGRSGPSVLTLAEHDPEFLRRAFDKDQVGQALADLNIPPATADSFVARGGASALALDRRAADIWRSLGHDGVLYSQDGRLSEIVDLRGDPPAGFVPDPKFTPRAEPPPVPPPSGIPSLEEIFGAPVSNNMSEISLRKPLMESDLPDLSGKIAENIPGNIPENVPPVLTGTRHAVTRAEQDAAGLPRTVPRPAVDAWEEARQTFERDPQAPRTLAQEVAANPRPLSDFETHLLAHDRASLKPAYDNALSAEEAALATGDPAQAAAAKLHRLAVERDFQTNADAADLGGSETGRGLQARQVDIAQDYSPLQLVRRYKVANLGEEVPDAVRSKLVDVSRKLEDSQARLAAAEERAQNLEAQRMIYTESQAAARETRSQGRAAVKAKLDQEYADLSAEWRKATGLAQAGVNPEQAAILAKKARNRVRAGVTNLQDLVDGVFQDSRPHLDTLEPQDVRDAIAGAGPLAQKAAKKQAVSDFAVLRREARVLNALDGAHAKLAAAGDSKAAAIAQKEVTRWEAELEKIHGGARQGGGPLSDPERVRASLASNAARQAELRAQIASGTIIPKTRSPVADAALLQARAETKGLQRQADAIIAKRELKNRSWLQKGLDLTAAIARFVPLTSMTGTLPKLAAAAGGRSLLIRPAEQLLSVADPYLPLLRDFAREAPVEGGGAGLNALKKSYQGFFSREAAQEATAHLRGEEGPLALALGKPHPPSGAPAFMDYPAHLHAAVKSPAVVAGYNWAMETQAAALRRAGTPITEALREEMQSRAWETAMRDILLEDNAAVSRFNHALQKLPDDSRTARVGIAGVRSQIPIVKVPINYAKQLTDYMFGLPKAGFGMGEALLKGNKALTAAGLPRDLPALVHAGLQDMPPGSADYIMRNLKRGRLGAVLAGLVLGGGVEMGGYYRKGEHRGPDDLQPGEMRIHGVSFQLPHNLLHQPPIEAMQALAAIKRAPDLYTGIKTAGLGVASQTPFFEENVKLGRDLPNNPAKVVGMTLRQFTEPPDIQKLARVFDQSAPRTAGEKTAQALGLAGLQVGSYKVPEIKARKRTPHGGFWEQLWKQEELGIPYLRERVR